RTAGNQLNNDIIQYIRNEFNVLLGEIAAEEVKIKIGSASILDDALEMKIRGRDLITGLPKEITVNDSQIRDALSRSVRLMTDDIKATLEVTPPELVADIYEKGMVLTGGGALLKNIDKAIARVTNIPVQIADDPLTAVVRGTGIVLEDVDSVRDYILTSGQEDNIK
ncbi:MAG TPA: rod shape-determining protein, partial [Patescibacteria group bacterium]